MEINARIEDELMPQSNCEARDEMNLAEFPLCALSHRLKPEIKTLRFEDQVWDKGRNATITRQLTVTGSDAYGLPTELDDEVLLGLIQISRLHGFAERKVPFTRHELIRILGWRDETKSYHRIEESLNRWTGVTLYYDKAWWNKDRKCWMDEKFHILDNVWLCHRNEPAPDTGLPARGAPLSAFVWNEVVFRSFCQGNLKSLDFEFFKSLHSAVAKRLYRFLDKRFFHRSICEFDLRELCCEHVGLSRNYPTANLKRKLLTGVRELEDRGFLRPPATGERFQKICRGKWNVIFERRTKVPPKKKGEVLYPLDSMTENLISRGVSEAVARNLREEFTTEQIQSRLEVFDWLTNRKDKRVSRSSVGYLVSSIKEQYEPPVDFIRRASIARETIPVIKQTTKKKTEHIQPLQEQQHLSRQQQTSIREYWNSLSSVERIHQEAEALAGAKPIQSDIINRGGSFASVTKILILDAHALKMILARS